MTVKRKLSELVKDIAAGMSKIDVQPDSALAKDIGELADRLDEMDAPRPMRLPCEGCGKLHVDKGEFATKPHHTHSCQYCGLTWRPAVFATVGVQFLPGFKDPD